MIKKKFSRKFYAYIKYIHIDLCAIKICLILFLLDDNKAQQLYKQIFTAYNFKNFNLTHFLCCKPHMAHTSLLFAVMHTKFGLPLALSYKQQSCSMRNIQLPCPTRKVLTHTLICIIFLLNTSMSQI